MSKPRLLQAKLDLSFQATPSATGAVSAACFKSSDVTYSDLTNTASTNPLSEFWRQFNWMYFPVPPFPEFDVPLVVIFRFIHYSMWGRSYVSIPSNSGRDHHNDLYQLHIFKLFFTVMKDNLFLQYRLRFFCTILPQVNLIKFSSHKSAELTGPSM